MVCFQKRRKEAWFVSEKPLAEEKNRSEKTKGFVSKEEKEETQSF